jgi:hypothetical protein
MFGAAGYWPKAGTYSSALCLAYLRDSGTYSALGLWAPSLHKIFYKFPARLNIDPIQTKSNYRSLAI